MNKIRKIKGIDSLYGNNLNKMEFIIFKMYEAVSKVGYKELQVPILEPAESYSEKVIGKSPSACAVCCSFVWRCICRSIPLSAGCRTPAICRRLWRPCGMSA